LGAVNFIFKNIFCHLIHNHIHNALLLKNQAGQNNMSQLEQSNRPKREQGALFEGVGGVKIPAAKMSTSL
jgi:hypothetical protein